MSTPTEPSASGAGPATDPATGEPLGDTRPAGEGIDDRSLSEEVAEQTSPDLRAAPVFEREADGPATDTPVEQADADELAGGEPG